MKIAYNPKDAVVVTATTAANNDILFDLNARKVWAKGLRMGADWEDISNKPSSLKNPEAIKFRDINGAEVSYDGSVAKNLMEGTYIAKLPYGFSSFTSEPTWGNVIGSSIASWNDASGGSIDFRKDNPSEGKMSIKVNGRVYVNGGFNPVLSAEFNNSYWGIRTPDGGNDWIRTPNTGLLPYTYGKAGSGHSSLGTNSWYFSTAYIDKVYGSLKGNADSATNADTVDGEHASNFVRAGHYESQDLNKLDTYSFIRSVNSNNKDTSPKGNIGWYNVIQLVHKNGMGEGSGYIGQIALGMTTNTNDMFFRGKRTDPWKTVIHSGNYTEFINNYYWANVKISTSSNSRTNPSFDTVYAATQINVGDIYLQNQNEINSTTSDLYINYNNTHNVKICNNKEGSVIIGPIPNNIDKNKLYVNGLATFTGLVTNIGGILPASYDVNKSNTSCYVWGDAMSTGVTAITDTLDPKYVTVVYSQSNGDSWIDSNLKPEEKFNLYANNGANISVYLGVNKTADSSGPNSLAQIQKNQLMVTFEIPNNMYSQLCWASIEISNGVNTVCTVEILDKSGTIKNTFTKNMQGWSMVNYINFWGINFPVVQIGQDSARFIRFKFKHDKSNTAIRNASIYKIRLFSFTKYYLNSNDFRSVTAYTGNLYKYDKDLNITFPNAIYCNTLNVGGIINCLANNISIKSKKSGSLMVDGREIIYYDSDTIGFLKKAYFGQRLCIGTMSPETGNNITTDDTSALIGEFVFWNTFTFIFKRGYDGQLLFLKLQKSYPNTTIYCATQDCSVVKAIDFGTHIALNDTKEIFGDGKARIFIYQSGYERWYEFYCG